MCGVFGRTPDCRRPDERTEERLEGGDLPDRAVPHPEAVVVAERDHPVAFREGLAGDLKRFLADEAGGLHA